MSQVEETVEAPTTTRRDFLRNLLGIGGAAAMVTIPISKIVVNDKATASATTSPRPTQEITFTGPVDPLERMRADLIRALQKTPQERHWVMIIDQRKCIGCHACTIACVAENKLPPGVVYRPVMIEEIGTYPNVTMRFTPRPCMQCDNPPCVPVCPVKATYKNEEGVVVVDYDQCIGCRYCVTACPYGARTFDFGSTYTEELPDAEGLIAGRTNAEGYERVSAFEYSETRPREGHTQSPAGNVRKCHFCLHRLKEGMLPACTTTCIGRATYFGDANDADSLVSELIASPNVMRLKEELGTEPRVYYLT